MEEKKVRYFISYFDSCPSPWGYMSIPHNKIINIHPLEWSKDQDQYITLMFWQKLEETD
jgi:hypothetical protein